MDRDSRRTSDCDETDPAKERQEDCSVAAECSTGKELMVYSKPKVIFCHDNCKDVEGVTPATPAPVALNFSWDADWAWLVDMSVVRNHTHL